MSRKKQIKDRLNLVSAMIGHVFVESELTAISIPILVTLLAYQILNLLKQDTKAITHTEWAVELAVFASLWQVFALAIRALGQIAYGEALPTVIRKSKYMMIIPPVVGLLSGAFLAKSKVANVQAVIEEQLAVEQERRPLIA